MRKRWPWRPIAGLLNDRKQRSGYLLFLREGGFSPDAFARCTKMASQPLICPFQARLHVPCVWFWRGSFNPNTSVALRHCLCWFYSHTRINRMFFLIQRLSVCDNCTWILDCEAGHGLLPSFTHVALCSVSWWYVKTVRRLLLRQQVLPFNSRCAFSRLAL